MRNIELDGNVKYMCMKIYVKIASRFWKIGKKSEKAIYAAFCTTFV